MRAGIESVVHQRSCTLCAHFDPSIVTRQSIPTRRPSRMGRRYHTATAMPITTAAAATRPIRYRRANLLPSHRPSPTDEASEYHARHRAFTSRKQHHVDSVACPVTRVAHTSYLVEGSTRRAEDAADEESG